MYVYFRVLSFQRPTSNDTSSNEDTERLDVGFQYHSPLMCLRLSLPCTVSFLHDTLFEVSKNLPLSLKNHGEKFYIVLFVLYL